MAKPVYLLYTNILSDLVRHPAGRVRDCIAERGEDSVCTSIIVAAELVPTARAQSTSMELRGSY